MGYRHTQTGWLHLLLYAVVGILLAGAWLTRAEPVAAILAGTAVVLLPLSLAFHHMTVEDEGDSLAIRYGPLPLMRKRIPYAEITEVEPDRTTLIDGWGIHWVLGRGWTYNLWGFQCVKLTLGRRVIRVGTDDVENLVAFLRGRLGGSRE